MLAVRYSEGDPRERHRGLSHHTQAVLALAGDVEIGWPEGLETPDGLERVTAVDVSRLGGRMRRLAALPHGPRSG